MRVTTTGFTEKTNVYTIIDIERLINSWIGNHRQIPLVIIQRIEEFSDLNAPLLQKNNINQSQNTNNTINTVHYKHIWHKLCILLVVLTFTITLSLHFFSFPNHYISSTDPIFVDYKPDFRDPLWPNNDIYFIETDDKQLEIACNFMISGRYQFIASSNGVFTYRKPFGAVDIIIDAHHTFGYKIYW